MPEPLLMQARYRNKLEQSVGEQLHQAGVLNAQKAILLGAFTDYRKSPLDRGYTLKTMVGHLRSVTKTPILTGLPFGHVPTKVTLPVGAKVTLLVQAGAVLIGW